MAETRDPILPVYPKLGDRSIEAVLRDMAEAGLERRLAQQVYTDEADEAAPAERAKPYRERLDYEPGVIEQMGYAGYFMIVADFITKAKQQSIPEGAGRGSGTGCLVARTRNHTH